MDATTGVVVALSPVAVDEVALRLSAKPDKNCWMIGRYEAISTTVSMSVWRSKVREWVLDSYNVSGGPERLTSCQCRVCKSSSPGRRSSLEAPMP